MPRDGSSSEHWRRVQGELFYWLEEHVGPPGSIKGVRTLLGNLKGS